MRIRVEAKMGKVSPDDALEAADMLNRVTLLACKIRATIANSELIASDVQARADAEARLAKGGREDDVRKTIGRFGWNHVGPCGGTVRDAWHCKDYGTALKTRLGWYVGNGVVGPIEKQGDRPVFCEPQVGPFPTSKAAIEAYDLAMDKWHG